MTHILDAVEFRCLKCNALMGTCDCWNKYVARLVKTETGWEARLDRPDGTEPIIWDYKRRHAALRKVEEWRAKGYEVEDVP
jgi:hypothetical protein